MYQKWLNRKAALKSDSSLGSVVGENKHRSSQETLKSRCDMTTPKSAFISQSILSSGGPKDVNKDLTGSSFFSSRNALNRSKADEKTEKYAR